MVTEIPKILKTQYYKTTLYYDNTFLSEVLGKARV